MGRRERCTVVALLIAALPLSACARTSAAESGGEPPATVQHVEGTDQSRVILSAEAAERLGIQTSSIREAHGPDGRESVIPYAAVLYDPSGKTWTYTNPEPLVFVRLPVHVTKIRGDVAFLSSGPPSGTVVVTVGASELLGVEYQVGGE